MNQPAHDTADRAVFIYREILQLCVLILAAAGAFVLTRTVAASNREMSLRDAAEWYRRGEVAIQAGRVDEAIDSLRRATVRNRSNKPYMLALAQALALRGDNDTARSVLLTLREAAPEDSDINLQLARLATARQDITDALRFYRNALYAPWPVEQADARRDVRLELIRFLLTHDQTGRARSEILALSTDLPGDVTLRLQVAHLFAKAGDNADALDQFQRVLRLAPANDDALAGAGQTAFELGKYALARTYLRRVMTDFDGVRNTREVVDLVLSNDPLVARLGSVERRRRLSADFAYAQQRLNACLEQPAGAQPTTDELSLQSDAHAFEDQLSSKRVLEQDTVEAGVDLIDRIERTVVQRCGPPTSFDRALTLIGRQHQSAGAESR